MSADVEKESPEITGYDVLLDYFRAGEKNSGCLLIGTEHEKLGVFSDDGRPIDYDHGVKPFLLAMQEFGWSIQGAQESPVALLRDGASITLEPGGQIELSGAPFETIDETADELRTHLRECEQVAKKIGIHFAALGFRPRKHVHEIQIVPKERYDIMYAYLPTKGRLAREMMKLSATVQANFDYISEKDMAAKLRLAQFGAPLTAALFANSPYAYNEFSGSRSRRYATWREVDGDRCGFLLFMFQRDFGYKDYIDWAISSPMFFIRREGRYIQATETTFREFLENGYQGHRATLADFENHLSTLFPEVRLKQFIEVRAADAGPANMILALPALWKGVLYDDDARAQALELFGDPSIDELSAWHYAASQDGLWGRMNDKLFYEVANEFVDIAKSGLMAEAKRCGRPASEVNYLAPLVAIIEKRQTLADSYLAEFGAGPLSDAKYQQLIQRTLYW